MCHQSLAVANEISGNIANVGWFDLPKFKMDRSKLSFSVKCSQGKKKINQKLQLTKFIWLVDYRCDTYSYWLSVQLGTKHKCSNYELHSDGFFLNDGMIFHFTEVQYIWIKRYQLKILKILKLILHVIYMIIVQRTN